MRRGAIISGAMHGGLILAVIVSDWWPSSRSEVPLVLTEVALIDGTDFDAALSTAPAPPTDAPEVLATPGAPETAPEPVASPARDARPSDSSPTASAPPEDAPDLPVVDAPPPPAPVPSEAARPTIAEVPVPEAPPRQAPTPESPPATEPVQPLASAEAALPGARPARPPDPEPEPAEAPAPPEPEPAEAPEPDPEIAEATEPEAPVAAAPQEARLPVARPAEIAAAAPASQETRRPDPEPAPEAEAPPEPAREAAPREPAATPETRPGAGGAAPAFASRVTRGERDALRLGIRQYFVYNGNRADRTLSVKIGIGLDPSGAIVEGPTLIEATGGDDASQRALFQAGVRALRRAALQGEFRRLPLTKYDAWKLIHVTFTPEDIGFPT